MTRFNAKFLMLFAFSGAAANGQPSYENSIAVDIFSRTVLIPSTCELNTSSLVRESSISYSCDDYDERGVRIPGIGVSIAANTAQTRAELTDMVAGLADEENWDMGLLEESVVAGYSHAYYRLSDLKNDIHLYVYRLCDPELCMNLFSATESRIEEIVASMFAANLYSD